MNFFRTGLVGWLLLAVAAGAELDDALIAAAKQHDAAAVARLLEQGANPNAASPTGETALHWATQGGDVAVAQRLLKAGTKVGANRYGVTPLIAACRRGDAAMIKLLLEADADVNGTTPDGRTPLMVAAQTGKPEAVGILLARGADPNARERSQSQTALMWAAAEGHVDAVQVLLGTGVDRHARSKSGFTAFLFAVRSGHSGVVQALLAAGISANETLIPDPKAPSGASALAVAVTNLHYALGALLLSAGADPNYIWQGRTVLHLLTWVSRPGAGSNAPAPEGSGTMDRAAFVRTLVKQGADVNRPMTSGRGGPRTVLNLRGATPFLLAARTADADLMRLLAELGADPLIPNSDGTTPLMVAAGIGVQSPGEDPGTESEVLEAVKIAVELGNEVNAVDRNGETALHGAAYKWAASVVPYLVEKGAKVEVWNQKNNNGWTPLRIATGVHRGMNLRSSPATAAALAKAMQAAGASTVVEPETNISGGTK